MAMEELLDEHEQSERVRRWLRDNAGGLFGGILLGLLAIGGWKWWEGHRVQQAQALAAQFDSAVASAMANPAGAEKALAGFDKPPYAVLAGLQLAKIHADAGKSDAAIATLRKLRVDDPQLQAVVKRRLARLLIQTGKPADAVATMNNATEIADLEILADAQLAQGQAALARATYQKALAKAEVGSPARAVLELKVSEVGGVPPKTEEKKS